MKMKALKSPKVGDKAVVASNDDTQVYIVAELNGLVAKLDYFDGRRMVTGGPFPADCLYQPTKAQLDSNARAGTELANQSR